MTFRGWPQDALDFYVGLEADNSKTYWLAHKQTYDECVKAPFLALSDEIEREFGPLHVFRPNRDIRFAKDKSPYKTAAAAVTESEGGAAYYVQISSEGLYVGLGLLPPRARSARALPRRRSPTRSPARSSRPPSPALRKKRYEVAARESLQRAPRGFPPDHPRVELLRMKGMHVGPDVRRAGLGAHVAARSTGSSRPGATRRR